MLVQRRTTIQVQKALSSPAIEYLDVENETLNYYLTNMV